MVDLVGFAGSALIIASLTMTTIGRLRIVGLVGAAVYVAYGFLLPAWPVVAMNTVTLSIHAFHLVRLGRPVAGSHRFPRPPGSHGLDLRRRGSPGEVRSARALMPRSILRSMTKLIGSTRRHISP